MSGRKLSLVCQIHEASCDKKKVPSWINFPGDAFRNIWESIRILAKYGSLNELKCLVVFPGFMFKNEPSQGYQ
jgi:hypothetical protein